MITIASDFPIFILRKVIHEKSIAFLEEQAAAGDTNALFTLGQYMVRKRSRDWSSPSLLSVISMAVARYNLAVLYERQRDRARLPKRPCIISKQLNKATLGLKTTSAICIPTARA